MSPTFTTTTTTTASTESNSSPAPYALNPHSLQLTTRPPPTYRGVFTSPLQTLPAGTLIETAPVLVIPAHEWEFGKKTALDHYAFVWGRRGDMAVAFGLGSMFNHSPSPNVSYIRDLGSETIRFYTSKRIPPETELTISYGPESSLWFEPSYPPEVDDPEKHAHTVQGEDEGEGRRGGDSGYGSSAASEGGEEEDGEGEGEGELERLFSLGGGGLGTGL